MEAKTGIKILIVEDEEDQRIRLKYVIESDGYQVDEAENGDKAIEMVKKNFYNLVVTDLKMPGKNDGLDVLQAVKRISENTDVIIVTAYGTIDSAVRAMISGAFDYIQKPINMPELRIKIERALKNRDVISKLDAKDILKNNVDVLSCEIDYYKKKLSDIHEDSKKLLSSIEADNPAYDVFKGIVERSSIR